ncbi:hypothetical protein DF268_15250 [Streptomyces sp. V2]|uniref:Integral membrane protein n=1 Tax=Streptomyces niveiscabiei TaxID=164115 RepID=A0ABW9I3E9_9ACTN|nr:hypothetical protein [Streptomyces sp. V2]PWG12640.1 hypothetical protein DF268_15250 [Streptomyces sp. V2]
MNPYLLIAPVAATVLLTFAVWRWMYLERKGLLVLPAASLIACLGMVVELHDRQSAGQVVVTFSFVWTGFALSIFLARHALADYLAAARRGVPAGENSIPRRHAVTFWVVVTSAFVLAQLVG